MASQPLFVPEFRFLTDVDDDGCVDKLSLEETVALTYLAAHPDCPQEVKSHGPFAIKELAKNLTGTAGLAAAVVALALRKPLVCVGDPIVSDVAVPVASWVRTVRQCVDDRLEGLPVCNHDVFFTKADDFEVIVYDPEVGTFTLPVENFASVVGAVWVDSLEESVEEPMTLVSFLMKFPAPGGIATVNLTELRRVAIGRALRPRILRVPYAIAVKRSVLQDWEESLAHEVPEDYRCVLSRLGELPVYREEDDFLEWLERAQDELLTSPRM